MGYLVFAARLHQIKRKKSNLNMRLMHVTTQKERIAQQIAKAEKAKTARQNLFNSSVRTTQNAIQTIMGIGNATSTFMATQQAMNFGAATNRQYANLITSLKYDNNGKAYIPAAQIEAVNGLKEALTGVMKKDNNNNNNYVFEEGKTDSDLNLKLNSWYSKQQAEAYNNQVSAQLTASAGQLVMNGIVQAGNFFMDVHNQVQDFCDSTELEQLNNIDAQLEQEKTSLETQLKALDEEEKAVQQALDKGIKDSAPKFA